MTLPYPAYQAIYARRIKAFSGTYTLYANTESWETVMVFGILR